MDSRDGATRRQVILLGAAAATMAWGGGCDRLVLPESELIDMIPAITSNDDFYVYSHGQVPQVDGVAWSCEVADRGTVLDTLDRDYLEGFEPVEIEHTLQCIGSGPRNQLISNARWEGVELEVILADLGITVDDSIVEILLRGADGYHTSVPVDDLGKPLWVVWRMNGEQLPIEHGFPARLLVPGRYGVKNVKWLTRIELLDTTHTSYWEARGWDREAEYKPNVLVRSPTTQTTLVAESVRFVGTAFAGDDPIVSVEVSLDDGATWQSAAIDYAPGADIWTLWHFDHDPDPGTVTLRTRATTESGAVVERMQDDDRMDGFDVAMSVEVTFT